MGGRVKISCDFENFLRTKFVGSRGKYQPDDDLEEDFDKIHADKTISNLEGLIRKQLSGALGESTKDVEIKLIAVKLPDGEEGDDWKLNTMVYNMMMGDMQGYEDME